MPLEGFGQECSQYVFLRPWFIVVFMMQKEAQGICNTIFFIYNMIRTSEILFVK